MIWRNTDVFVHVKHFNARPIDELRFHEFGGYFQLRIAGGHYDSSPTELLNGLRDYFGRFFCRHFAGIAL